MLTTLIVLCWLLLVLVVIQQLRIMSLGRYITRKTDYLVDDAITQRKYLSEAEDIIQRYKRVHETDTAMVERTLKELEQKKESIVELLAKLKRYDGYSTDAYRHLIEYSNDIRLSFSAANHPKLIRAIDCINQLVNDK